MLHLGIGQLHVFSSVLNLGPAGSVLMCTTVCKKVPVVQINSGASTERQDAQYIAYLYATNTSYKTEPIRRIANAIFCLISSYIRCAERALSEERLE